ncbi:tetR-family transcriptional regulator [Mycobacterium xenopi 4042]|uniref:TetR-family transcriptional regulator n=1 Tax=Mycobacterium xenopi 4042 TaxID=1299334 RepID=X8DY11_MYCXE|nr:tetR-family transcriptional regulator [Mycobacterium xenopi 4042]
MYALPKPPPHDGPARRRETGRGVDDPAGAHAKQRTNHRYRQITSPPPSEMPTAVTSSTHEISVYRRWRTRQDLIIDALLDRSAAEIPVPDTGSLRGDLIELARLVSRYLSLPLGRALVRMTALTVEDEALARASAEFFGSRVATVRVVVDRAIERGNRLQARMPDSCSSC